MIYLYDWAPTEQIIIIRIVWYYMPLNYMESVLVIEKWG